MADGRPAGRGLETEAQYLKGVGPQGAMILRRLGLETVRDVLWHFPRRFEDRRNLPPIMMAQPGRPATLRGVVVQVESRPLRGGKKLVRVRIEDDTGVADLVWFNQPWLAKRFQHGQEVIAYGMVKEARGRLEVSAPEFELMEDEEDVEDFAKIVPVYPLKEGVGQLLVRRAAAAAAEHFAGQADDPVPESIRGRFQLPSLAWSLRSMHLPAELHDHDRARRRIAFDEFLVLQLELQIRRRMLQKEVGISFPISNLGADDRPPTTLFDSAEPTEGLWPEIHRILPFELTRAQTRVIGEVFADMERPVPMNRLVQGDVGSGKTAVAACAILAAVRCGYQAALMAPTEILAEQHAANLTRLFDPIGIPVVMLSGRLNARQKRRALELAASGEGRLCVGTHALVQEGVVFHRLGLAVIDEQHRFGVLQRATLRSKGLGNPDVLVMTATPIPRTMTMAVHGDLDVSVIDELPPGRRPIKTHWRTPDRRDDVYARVDGLLEEGRQAYIVCPMIAESDKMQAQAAEELYNRLRTTIYTHRRVGLLHGQMKPAEKDAVMDAFRRHDLDILVSTVVIEVGVDVPNATVMIIEDAERFGLAQLHQLRGRVGRGAHQSFCILISEGRSEESQARLKVMVETTDGFRIAEEDLRLRGPGDVAGTRQSGALDFRVADLVRDSVMLEKAREAAGMLLDDDPQLELPQHQALLDMVRSKRTEDSSIAIS
ncbi:MAG: ATP-dependent DNA helicase RecG [Fimbriimonadaceae bacterium]|nr:ATP-dependent DNA helicase RecG [Fimbriimonadaceae bacterium]